MSEQVLSERAKQVLKALIDTYIADGTPVGSKTIAQLPDMMCSPATVRNVMAELEALGLILSPHTSAGRIPTDKGFRLFVDSLLTVRPLSIQTIQELHTSIEGNYEPNRLIQSASSLLSSMTKLAGVVTTPKRNKVVLRQMEFLKLAPHKILVIMVMNSTEVQNRIIMTQREFSDSELTRAGNYLTKTFGGQSLDTIRAQLLDKLHQNKAELDDMMRAAMSFAEQSFSAPQDEADYVLAGENHLFHQFDDNGVSALKGLFDAFTDKRDLLTLFDQCMQAEGVQIFIGEESGFAGMEEFSLITAPYQEEGEPIGIIGVIGPTRMRYHEVLPIVDMTSKILSMAMGTDQDS